MISRKKLIVIIVACVFFVLIVVATLVMRNTSSEQEQSTKKSATSFYIDGLGDSKYLFSTDTQKAITQGVEQYLKRGDIKTDGIKGVIRQNSYAQNEVYGATVITLLIDIPEGERTYKISSSGSGSSDGDNSLYILCPSKDELIYAAFTCTDDSV